MEFQISLFEAIVTSVLTAGMVSMFVMIWRFIKEQRVVLIKKVKEHCRRDPFISVRE